ncbi:DJ-1/PfpI family protein [Nonomuraea dietziae]|uniref:DJ-1/PfpI family protein n=1 Tax=Nonomuraea dietziae TaxID=65515 RepID=UPI0031E1B475
MLVPPPSRLPTVAALAFDGMSPFELGCVVEIFGLSRPELRVPWYDLKVCAEGNEPMRVVGGFSMRAEHGLDVLASADTVIVPGVADVRAPVSPALVAALRQAFERKARIVSICSGAFALAAAGLLDGREATTHWKYADLLQRRFPEIRVNTDVLYVDGGQILTSAGSAAGLDLLVHLVRTDHGATVANAVARRLVIPPHRDGGQAQFIQARGDAGRRGRRGGQGDGVGAGPPERADQRRRSGEDGPHGGAHLRQAIQGQTGTSPLRWVISQRVAASLPMLESTGAPVEEIGAAVGFESPVTFRHHFTRAMRTSPSAYRRAFSAAR